MTRNTLDPVARLVPPHGDKGWSFQVANRLEDHERSVRQCMQSPAVKAANPFLQGCSPDWLMVEFWTKDKNLVDSACEHLSKELGLQCSEGQFTRQDLGLPPDTEQSRG